MTALSSVGQRRSGLQRDKHGSGLTFSREVNPLLSHRCLKRYALRAYCHRYAALFFSSTNGGFTSVRFNLAPRCRPRAASTQRPWSPTPTQSPRSRSATTFPTPRDPRRTVRIEHRSFRAHDSPIARSEKHDLCLSRLSRFSATSASRPMKSAPLSSFTVHPSPAVSGEISAVISCP